MNAPLCVYPLTFNKKCSGGAFILKSVDYRWYRFFTTREIVNLRVNDTDLKNILLKTTLSLYWQIYYIFVPEELTVLPRHKRSREKVCFIL